jgi:hypothetical protein
MKRIMSIIAVTAALACGQEKQSAEAPNVELTVYLLSGLSQGTTDDVPQDLGPTLKQLHSVFAYKSYKLTESFVLRGRSSTSLRSASTDGVLPGTGLHYHFGFSRLWVTGDAPRTVHVDGLNLNLWRQVITKESDKDVANIKTDLDIRDGQKTVVGKSSVDSTGDALILVIVPKVVD